MKLAIVGNEAAKFDRLHEAAARATIMNRINTLKPHLIISGGCHLGGVDIYAEEIADQFRVPKLIFAPATHTWSGKGGYKARNEKIAQACDLCLVIVVAELPTEYDGMRFKGCYHCKDRNPPHVKSGACWTAWRSKAAEWVVL